MLGIVYCLCDRGRRRGGKPKGWLVVVGDQGQNQFTFKQGKQHNLRSFKHFIHTPRTFRLGENRVLVRFEITARPGYEGVEKGVRVGGGGCVECAGEAEFGCSVAIFFMFFFKRRSSVADRGGGRKEREPGILVNLTSQRPITRRIIIQHGIQHAHQRIVRITNRCQLTLAI